MCPETGSVFVLVIAMLVRTLLQKMMYNDPLMRKATHSFPYLHIHITMVGNFVTDIVFLNHIVRKICHFEVDLFVSRQWSDEVDL